MKIRSRRREYMFLKMYERIDKGAANEQPPLSDF